MADDAALLDVLREVVDPELMINIVDLGLVYDIEQVDNKVTVQMTLTSPACPAGPQIIQQAKMALEKLADVSEAEIKLVMSPPWTPDRMTDEARDQLGQAYLQKKMYEQAIAEFQTAVQLSGGSSVFVANLARAYASAGKTKDATRLLDELKKGSAPGSSNASEIATIYAALGNKDEAMKWIEKGYEERFNPGVLTRLGFDPLRSDPRFQDALRRIGLPQ